MFNKNLKNLFGLTALTALSLTGCINADDNSEWLDPNRAISFSSAIGSTRITGSTWNDGDQVGIFMKPAGSSLSAALSENKRHLASANGLLVNDGNEHALYYPADGSKVDFVAYYPFSAELTNQTVNVNVQNQSTPAEIDLLYSTTNTGYSNTSSAVALNFKHQLSKMVLNITKQNDLDATGMTVALEGTATEASFDLASGKLTAKSNTTAAIEYKLTDKGNNQYQAEAILLPVAKLGAGAELAFTIAGQTYKHSLENTPLTPSSTLSFNVTLGTVDGNPTIVVGQATITDWVTVPGGDINIDMDGSTTDPNPEPEPEPEPTPGVEQTIFTEGFGTVEKVNGYWPGVNVHTNYENASFLFTDSTFDPVKNYGNASIRSTSTLSAHVWLAADKDSDFQITGFSTTGYTNLKLTYQITANAAGRQENIVVMGNDVAVSVPSAAIAAINEFQTVEVTLPNGITSIKFVSGATSNKAGFRIDNITLVGTK